MNTKRQVVPDSWKLNLENTKEVWIKLSWLQHEKDGILKEIEDQPTILFFLHVNDNPEEFLQKTSKDNPEEFLRKKDNPKEFLQKTSKDILFADALHTHYGSFEQNVARSRKEKTMSGNWELKKQPELHFHAHLWFANDTLFLCDADFE